MWPVKGTVVSEYSKGETDGIKIMATRGDKVVAADDGIVGAVSLSDAIIPVVVLKHSNGLMTVYAHIDDISVRKGWQLKKGDGIGKVPASGKDQIHFEVRKGFDSLNPLDFLPSSKDIKIIKSRAGQITTV